MKYKIVWAHDSSQLELEVNRMMLEGWQPIGGLAAMSQSYGIDTFKGVLGGLEGTIDTIEYLYQAMIYRPSPKPPGSPG